MLKPNVLIFATLVVALLFSMSTAHANNKRLAQGEVIVTAKEIKGSDLPKVETRAVIKAPVQKVWALIENCKNYKKTMLNVAEAKEISRKGNKVRCKTVADLPWPMDDLTSVTEATHTVEEGKKYVRSWKLVKGDYEFNNGSWVLTPFKEDQTLVVYTLHVKPTTAVPDFLKTQAMESNLPKLIHHLRGQLEK